MSDNRFVLGVDLDGVCADFYGGLRKIAAEWTGRSIEELTEDVTYGLPEWRLDEIGGKDSYEKLHRFAVTQRDLFKTLAPIAGAPVALRRLGYRDDVRIRIITHRLFIANFHELAIVQTIQWLDQYGIPYWDLCLMRDKAAVGADLYIEDSPSNVEALRAAGKDVIAFGNSTNKGIAEPRLSSWHEVEELVCTKIDEWKARAVGGTSIDGE